MAKKKKKVKNIYTITLGKIFKQPKTKRAGKSIKVIKEFLSKQSKKEVKIDSSLNEKIWAKSRENPPRKIKVKVSEEGGIIKASLAE